MSAYVLLGQDLYDFVDGIDISGINAEWTEWAYSFNRPPKSDEMPDYPCFAVVPTRDEPATLDSVSDDDVITYSVFIFFSYYDATVGENSIRALVDRVRSAFRSERSNPETLGNSYDLSFRGEWGGDETQVERFYRLDVTARIAEDL